MTEPALFFRRRPPVQIGIVVRDLDRSLAIYAERMALGEWRCYTYGPGFLREATFRGQPASYAMRLALNSERPQLELIESTQGPNLYEEWLREHGEGMHHLGYFVDSISETTHAMAAAGYPPVQTGYGTGVDGDGGYAYFDLRDELGYYVEAIEAPQRRRVPQQIVR